MSKKKKGFTLIELVIVLAVLAVIALIAIPNFTKIRSKSIVDADFRAAEQIEKITLMGIANGDIKEDVTTFFVFNDGKIRATSASTDTAELVFKDLFRECNGPQVPTTVVKAFEVKIVNGAVSVGYTVATTFNNVTYGKWLAGELKS